MSSLAAPGNEKREPHREGFEETHLNNLCPNEFGAVGGAHCVQHSGAVRPVNSS